MRDHSRTILNEAEHDKTVFINKDARQKISKPKVKVKSPLAKRNDSVDRAVTIATSGHMSNAPVDVREIFDKSIWKHLKKAGIRYIDELPQTGSELIAIRGIGLKSAKKILQEINDAKN
jgi:DNA-directed RNA polymerase alpha subunit